MDEEIKKGLEGVIIDTTSISNVLPEISSLIYRGYNINDLAENCSFEEVAYLIWNGQLPNKEQLEKFKEKEKRYREFSEKLLCFIKNLPKTISEMDALKICVDFLGVENPKVTNNNEEAIKLLSKTSLLIAAIYRHKNDKEIILPRKDLNFSENFFYMCFGKVPEKEIVKAFDVSLILYAEHGFNASTFTARVVTSTKSDIYSAISAAIGTLKGPLHGGANIRVMEMLKEIKSPELAKDYILTKLSQKQKIPGFGHRVYRKADSRVAILRKYFEKISAIKNNSKWLEISNILEETMLNEKNIYPNVDFPIGPLYYLMDFDLGMYVSIFAMARTVGWTAHIIEQSENNKLIRPLSKYVGSELKEFVLIDKRN